MFKKIAIGCGILVLLLTIVLGVAAYWTYSKAKEFVGSFTQLAQVTELDKQVSNIAAFAPPESGELTADQLARLAKINEQVQGALGAKFAEMKVRYDQLGAQMKNEQRDASAAEALAALKDLGTMVKDVRTAQVAAINAQRMSLAEYRWVRDQAFAAAGIPIGAFNLNGFIEAAKSGDQDGIAASMQRQVTEAIEPNVANKELVKPLAAKLQEWTALAWMGF